MAVEWLDIDVLGKFRLDFLHLLPFCDIFFGLLDFPNSFIVVHRAFAVLRFVRGIRVLFLLVDEVPDSLRFALVLHSFLSVFQLLPFRWEFDI